MTRNDIVTRADGTQIELSPVGQGIVFENEHVRVWEISLEPGQQGEGTGSFCASTTALRQVSVMDLSANR